MESAFEGLTPHNRELKTEPGSNLAARLLELRHVDLTPAPPVSLSEFQRCSRFLLAYASDRELHPARQVMPGQIEGAVLVRCRNDQTASLHPDPTGPSGYCFELFDETGRLLSRRDLKAAQLEALAENCSLVPTPTQEDPLALTCAQVRNLIGAVPRLEQAQLLMQKFDSWAEPNPHWYDGRYDSSEARLAGEMEFAERKATIEFLVQALPNLLFEAKERNPQLLRRVIEEELEELASKNANLPGMPKLLHFALRKLNQLIARHASIEKLHGDASIRYQNPSGVYGFENTYDRGDKLGLAKFCAHLILGLDS
ncbi:MAG: hypothetical protein K1X83_08500 [Oligoflexia bacterium]|nr:hypothetical protein [Oligoflexia bacterium]